MIKKTIFATCLGLLITGYYIQKDRWFCDHIADLISKKIANVSSCAINQYTVENCSFLHSSMTIKDIFIQPPKLTDQLNKTENEKWHIIIDQATISWSWISLFLYGSIELCIDITTARLKSAYTEKTCDLALYLKELVLSEYKFAIPITLQKTMIKALHIDLNHEKKDLHFKLETSALAKKVANTKKIILYLNQAKLSQKSYDQKNNTHYKEIIHSLCSSVETTIDSDNNAHINGSTSFIIAQLKDHNKQCHGTLRWAKDSGSIMLKNISRTINLTARLNKQKINLTAHSTIDQLLKLTTNNTHQIPISGKLKLDVTINTPNNISNFTIEKSTIRGSLLAEDIQSPIGSLASLAQINFEKQNHKMSSKLYWQHNSGIVLNGTWQYNQFTNCGSGEVHNMTTNFFSPTSHWCLPAYKTYLSADIDSSGHIKGIYESTAHNKKLSTNKKTGGNFSITPSNLLSIAGSLHKNHYRVILQLQPTVELKELVYYDKNQKKQLDIYTLNNNSTSFNKKSSAISSYIAHEDTRQELAAHVDFELIKNIAHQWGLKEVQGEGYFSTTATIKKDGIFCRSQLHNGTIRLPQTYNFINSFSMESFFDWSHKKILIQNMQCNLHKGSISTHKGCIYYGNNFYPTFVYMPLLFQNCLLNIQKDLFATVSGRLLFHQAPAVDPLLSGSIIFGAAQLSENIFSFSAQQELAKNAYTLFTPSQFSQIKLELAVESVQPIYVKTPFLEADAHLRFFITNTIQHPHARGEIHLISGNLKFPYKPLHITKGSLYFMPHQMYDPLIEVEARNTIRKNTVTMQITGSVKNHHISLHSSPTLSEEQIIALLLIGSTEESLNIVMPALIMQNVKQLLFSTDHTHKKIEKYFTGFLKPLKHITLVPSFVDQTGRGGLRGAIEINIHDRVRALIQRNFSLTEDTRFEVEYMLSDDISLRAIRDERRDLSGQVEMKWKF